VAQFLGKDLHFFRLDPFNAAHAKRQPHDYLGYAKLLDHAAQVVEVGFLVAPVVRRKALSGKAQLVADGQPDLSRPEVDGEDALH
jgi:antitoxin component of MazEF toxin-antitoxin module